MALSLYQHCGKKCNNINILLIPVENLHYCNQLDFIWSNQKPQQNLMKFCVCVHECAFTIWLKCVFLLCYLWLAICFGIMSKYMSNCMAIVGKNCGRLWTACIWTSFFLFIFFCWIQTIETISLKYDAPNISLLKWMNIKFVHILGLLTFLLKFHNMWKQNFHLPTSNVCMLFHMVKKHKKHWNEIDDSWMKRNSFHFIFFLA